MNLQNELQTRPINKARLIKFILIGAGIALILISFFLFMAGDGNPEWPNYWRLRPLIVVPLAGATGGVCFYVLDYLSYKGSWRKVLAIFFGVVIYIIGLWMGTVLGLLGTMWN